MLLWYAIYMGVACSVVGVMVGVDDEMSKTTMDGRRIDFWKLVVLGLFWVPFLAATPALLISKWLVSRNPAVIAKRLEVADRKSAKMDTKGNW